MTWLDADSRLARLNGPLIYEVGHLGSGLLIECPEGMISDGASDLPLVWDFAPPWGGPYERPSVVHDRLCFLLANGAPHPLAPTYDRAAEIFHEAMIVTNTPVWQRDAMYAAVKVWSDLPNRFKGTDANPYPCGSVQPLEVVVSAIKAKAA